MGPARGGGEAPNHLSGGEGAPHAGTVPGVPDRTATLSRPAQGPASRQVERHTIERQQPRTTNTSGPQFCPTESPTSLETVRTWSTHAAWIACCGSLPRGLAPGWYADLVAGAREAGTRIALDTTGPALLAALPARPDVIKPNASELAAAVGRPLSTLADVTEAAQELRARGAGAVLASLGADGQLLVAEEGTYYGTARVPVDRVRSNVGAGDASLAGFLVAGGTGPAALASALAHGAAAVQLPGSAMLTPADLSPEAVRVTQDLPLDLRLSEPATA
ncbi:PfkB family carbohydrate kinase [Streptomyces sp. NBC_01351]|uniref:1-phosphofructokinase family hexose kinase n=1 Tax=Streptomyces sp. NBC_01351 TaxID=2903833 RepID=UPI002E2F1A52|nr:PfkB family carbohydrate kinase [Streptomyces sp. NBC_01351]